MGLKERIYAIAGSGFALSILVYLTNPLVQLGLAVELGGDVEPIRQGCQDNVDKYLDHIGYGENFITGSLPCQLIGFPPPDFGDVVWTLGVGSVLYFLDGNGTPIIDVDTNQPKVNEIEDIFDPYLQLPNESIIRIPVTQSSGEISETVLLDYALKRTPDRITIDSLQSDTWFEAQITSGISNEKTLKHDIAVIDVLGKRDIGLRAAELFDLSVDYFDNTNVEGIPPGPVTVIEGVWTNPGYSVNYEQFVTNLEQAMNEVYGDDKTLSEMSIPMVTERIDRFKLEHPDLFIRAAAETWNGRQAARNGFVIQHLDDIHYQYTKYGANTFEYIVAFFRKMK